MAFLPLKDITILDLSWVLAGPHATRQFCELGATIIKVESSKSIDVVRSGAQRKNNDSFKKEGGWAFQDQNRNKIDIGINLKTAKGREILEELVKRSDAVVCNYGSSAFRKLRLHYDDLKQIKDDVIVLNASGLGDWGPYSQFVTFAPCLMGLTGMTGSIGYENSSTPYDGYPPLADYLGALAVCNALLAAIEYRRKTGKGQFVDLSQGEAAVSYIGVPIIDWQVNQKASALRGNQHHSDSIVPHNVYKCKGDDTAWCAIAIGDEAQWQRFRALVDPECGKLLNEKFGTLALRLKNRAELDSIISNWTSTMTPNEVGCLLQHHGISGAPVQTARQAMFEDGHLADRNFWQEVEYPSSEKFPPYYKVTGPIFRDEKTPHFCKPAPGLGENTAYVLRDLLNKSEEWISEAYSEGAVE